MCGEGKDLYHWSQDFMTVIQALRNSVQGEMSSSTHQELGNIPHIERHLTYDRGGITNLGVKKGYSIVRLTHLLTI